jgi:hypothetical protein
MILASIGIIGSTNLDLDAQKFINAAGITDSIQINAINQLVLDLKGASLWNKFLMLYPFVGGTASSHKFNLKDPQDTDNAFRILFSGGWIHSSTGAKPNGINAYGDTRLLPGQWLFDIPNIHISYYSRTNSLSGADIGGSNASYTRGLLIMPRYTDEKIYMSVIGASSTIGTPGIVPSAGFIMLRRNNNTQIIASINANNTTYASNSFIHGTYYLSLSAITVGNINPTRNLYSDRELALASVGYGLNDTQAAAFNIIVQAFQTTLGRNV